MRDQTTPAVTPATTPAKKKKIYIRGGGIRNKRQISLIPIITINKGDISLKIGCKLYSCLSFKKPRLKHKFWNKFRFRLLFDGADFNSQGSQTNICLPLCAMLLTHPVIRKDLSLLYIITCVIHHTLRMYQQKLKAKNMTNIS